MQKTSEDAAPAGARSVGISELKRRASEIVREVEESRVPVDITVRGKVVARLAPTMPSPSTDAIRADMTEFWRDWDQLAAEVSASWPKGVSAVDAVREQRRDL